MYRSIYVGVVGMSCTWLGRSLLGISEVCTYIIIIASVIWLSWRELKTHSGAKNELNEAYPSCDNYTMYQQNVRFRASVNVVKESN